MTYLTSEQRRSWTASGYIIVSDVLDADARSALATCVDEIAAPPGAGAQRLHYFEQTDVGRILCRTERFVEDHPAIASFIGNGLLPQIAAELIGEPVLLFKDKINYKGPGGGGYAAHQDVVAYAFAKKLVTCLVALDDMNDENGCLEFSPMPRSTLLPVNADGCIDPGLAEKLDWKRAPISAGGAIYFTAHVPHRSAANRTTGWRRALYLTYHAAAEGPLRAAYYNWRAQKMAAAAAEGKTCVSTIRDFLGRIVS